MYIDIQLLGPVLLFATAARQASLSFTISWSLLRLMSIIGEGNGNPLQCSCLENPGDGGAWWAAIYGVAQSRTWLRQLSSSSMSIESVMPSNHLILSLFQLQGLFQWIGSSHQVAKVLQFQHQSLQCNEFSGFDVWIFKKKCFLNLADFFFF